MQQDDISPTKGRGYGHVTVLKFYRFVMHRADLSATAELLVFVCSQSLFVMKIVRKVCKCTSFKFNK